MPPMPEPRRPRSRPVRGRGPHRPEPPSVGAYGWGGQPWSSPSGQDELETDRTLSASRPDPNQNIEPASASMSTDNTAASGSPLTNPIGDADPSVPLPPPPPPSEGVGVEK